MASPANAGIEPMLGEISLYAFDFAPRDWAHANGQMLPIAQNAQLYSVMGTAHGGNGVQFFALPDLRGRSPVGATPARPVGHTFGRNFAPLNTIPGVVGTQLTLVGTGIATSSRFPGTQTLVQLDKAELTSGGSGNPIPLRPPSLAIPFSVALAGTYQSRSCMLGEVVLHAGNATPESSVFQPADGRLLSRFSYPGLFTVIGYQFGGDGNTQFALPDLRDRLATGATTELPGIAPLAFAEATGTPSVTLTSNHTRNIALGRHISSGALGAATTNRPTETSIAVLTGSAAVDNGPIELDIQPPSLALNYYVCVGGEYPVAEGSSAGDDAYIGEIRLFAGNYAPSGWAFANGQLLSISSYTTLYMLITTTYGGNGVVTFGLPDLRGRIPVHPGTLGIETLMHGQSAGASEATLSLSHVPPASPLGDAALLSSATPTSAIPISAARGARTVQSQQQISTGWADSIPRRPPALGLHYIIRLQGIFPPQN